MTNNAFDFSNVADLPEELAAKLTAETNGNVDTFVNVVAKGKEAGFDTLEINQIMAAAHRLGVDVPTQQTVRNYLNKACEQGKLVKPTRQSYALGDGTVAADPAATEEAASEAEDQVENEADANEDDDPLAGIE
tara:strand:+ start:41502 stop:41903 length:402 start_codon:yes stop_codon:yes gene_type:complete